MKENFMRKNFYISNTHIDILDNLMKEIPGIDNYSSAIRYIIQAFAEQKSSDPVSDNRKLNQMAKNVDMLIEMVAGGFTFQDVNSIRPAEETFIYQDAKKHVERNIQRSTTKKSEQRSNLNRESNTREPIFKL